MKTLAAALAAVILYVVVVLQGSVTPSSEVIGKGNSGNCWWLTLRADGRDGNLLVDAATWQRYGLRSTYPDAVPLLNETCPEG